MPKLARAYDENRYYVQHRTLSSVSQPYGTRYESYDYQQLHTTSAPQRIRRKRVKPKKKSILHFLISFLVLVFMAVFIMTYSFNGLIKSAFVPTPYKNVTTDIRQIAFPVNNYLANSWALGERVISYTPDAKYSQMVSLDENVNMPVLHRELMNLMELYPTVKTALYVWDYDTKNYIDINGSKIYSTASIIKIPVLIDVFQSIEAGQFSLEDEMPLTEYFRTEGSGSMQFKARDSKYSIDELARRMITESDNSATNMLMAKVGSMTDVNNSIRNRGWKHTKVNTGLPDLAGTN